MAGYGLGPMLWAPMSEIPQIGRNPVYIGTLFAFVVLQLPVALAENFAMLLCFRFITGGEFNPWHLAQELFSNSFEAYMVMHRLRRISCPCHRWCFDVRIPIIS